MDWKKPRRPFMILSRICLKACLYLWQCLAARHSGARKLEFMGGLFVKIANRRYPMVRPQDRSFYFFNLSISYYQERWNGMPHIEPHILLPNQNLMPSFIRLVCTPFHHSESDQSLDARYGGHRNGILSV